MRAWIVGNGPSLSRTNLDKLIGETTFACNNIHLIYGQTRWRPTYYIRGEEAGYLEPEHWIDSMNIQMAGESEIWCNEWFQREHPGYKPTRKVNTIKSCAHYQRNFNDPASPHLWHMPVLCAFGSSVNVAVQIAVQLGYGPLYLVGCDLDYKNGKPNHFSSEYENGLEKDNMYQNSNALAAHMVAARSCPVPIYNATIGGVLEAFPRVEFESLF
jgi:hypothetical protein